MEGFRIRGALGYIDPLNKLPFKGVSRVLLRKAGGVASKLFGCFVYQGFELIFMRVVTICNAFLWRVPSLRLCLDVVFCCSRVVQRPDTDTGVPTLSIIGIAVQGLGALRLRNSSCLGHGAQATKCFGEWVFGVTILQVVKYGGLYSGNTSLEFRFWGLGSSVN